MSTCFGLANVVAPKVIDRLGLCDASKGIDGLVSNALADTEVRPWVGLYGGAGMSSTAVGGACKPGAFPVSLEVGAFPSLSFPFFLRKVN